MSNREGDFGLSFWFFWGVHPLFHPQLGDFKDNNKIGMYHKFGTKLIKNVQDKLQVHIHHGVYNFDFCFITQCEYGSTYFSLILMCKWYGLVEHILTFLELVCDWLIWLL
jgi:hypothetical protein